MKKIQILALALFTMLALGTVATSAFAEEEVNAQWLAAAGPILAALAATTTTELLLEESVIGAKAAVLCIVLFSGSVGPGMEDEITKMLNSAGEQISELETGLGLACEAKETCAASPDAELRPEELPWNTLVDLMNPSGKFLDLIHIKLVVNCLIMGFNVADLCEGLTSSELKNVVGGSVEQIFSAAVGTETLTCNQGGEGTGSIATVGLPTLIKLNGTEALTVSE
jgi:hypothetical protein